MAEDEYSFLVAEVERVGQSEFRLRSLVGLHVIEEEAATTKYQRCTELRGSGGMAWRDTGWKVTKKLAQFRMVHSGEKLL